MCFDGLQHKGTMSTKHCKDISRASRYMDIWHLCFCTDMYYEYYWQKSRDV